MNVQSARSTDPQLAAYLAQRNITEVLHFTTNKGLLGIFASGEVLSRDRLEENKYIEHIRTFNCADRLKDANWTDYVNLSISRVNGRMLGVSENWHGEEELWWVVLSFDASLLVRPSIYFTTTNNTYTACVRRGVGVGGLAALFAPTVEWGWYGSRIARPPDLPTYYTTDPQAEVLYPRAVPVTYLRKVYVRDPENIDYVRSLLPLFSAVPHVPVEHRPEVFQ
ncbi:hypothetical protein GCM10023321_19260 [Pseudonocardia eucalypti]|uniref:DarT domain-containing protein n=1 Tax=Pseudonocardia eucalypti TaxID=648755 RepID=A0ABP9PUC1_9PSEU|nr:hypothetical protein [Pseudonocardia eucalypti]